MSEKALYNTFYMSWNWVIFNKDWKVKKRKFLNNEK